MEILETFNELNESLNTFLLNAGMWAPLLSSLLIVLEAIFAFLPLCVFVTINLLTMGNIFGCIVSYCCTIVGCFLTFLLCRVGLNPLCYHMAMRQRPMPQKNSNHNDDSVIYRIMAALLMLCVLLISLQFVSRYYSVVGTMFVTQNVILGVGIGSAVLFLASVGLWFYSRRTRPLLHSFSIGLGIFFLITGLSCWLLYTTWVEHIPHLYALYIGAAVLYMIALLYQREFFLLSCVNAAAGLVFYTLSRVSTGRVLAMAMYAFLVVVIAIVVLLVRKARKSDDGTLKLKGRTIAISTASTSPLPIYISCVVWVLCLAVAAFLGSVFAYYCIFVVAAFELAAAVYYTVKLS